MAVSDGAFPRIVYKLGGSILRDAQDYAFYAGRLRDVLSERPNTQLVVVVSAQFGETDRLLAQSFDAGGSDDDAATALLLATGELQSVARLTIALTRLGVSAVGIGPEQTGITLLDGTRAEDRLAVDRRRVESFLRARQVVVVPGFVGTTSTGQWVTLGRGGSDLSAVALAAALNAESCELIKDVPGYFTRDPNQDANAEHIAQLDFNRALQMAEAGCDLVQLDALRYAKAQRLQLIIRDLKTRARWTCVCDSLSVQPSVVPEQDVLAVA